MAADTTSRSDLRQEKIMAFVVTQRLCNVSRLRGGSMLRAGRQFAAKLGARAALTPQERANLYVSRMPIAVVTASLGGHPSDRPAGYR
ncbi:hypothetical protein AWC11_26760 [Mycobacterium interjectum]|nr:hypothetical protein AWC11_26760 [Mycobacterium interjectum]